MENEVKPLRFYTDKHIPKAVATQLRNRGIDIVRCEEIGLGDAPDHVHLEYAANQGRVVITNDADFTRLHGEWQLEGKVHAGIFLCLSHIQGERGIGTIVNEVVGYYDLIEGGAGSVESDIANRLIFVS